MKRIVTLLLFATLLTGSVGLALSQTSGPAQLSIDDTLTGARLTSDGNGLYIDSSLVAGNPCVSTQVTSSGIFSAKMDFNAAVYPNDCDSTLNPTPIRSFNLTLDDATACQTLTGSSNHPCTINVGPGSDSNKIFAGALFSTTAPNPLVQFLFSTDGKFYSLKTNFSKTNSGATVTGTGSTRTVTYSGNATLFLVKPSVKRDTQIGGSFSFPFSFTVTVP